MKRIVSVRLDPALLDRARERARAERRSLASLVEVALDYYMREVPVMAKRPWSAVLDAEALAMVASRFGLQPKDLEDRGWPGHAYAGNVIDKLVTAYGARYSDARRAVEQALGMASPSDED